MRIAVDVPGGRHRGRRRLRVGVGLSLLVLVTVRVLVPDGDLGTAAHLVAAVGGAVIAFVGLRRGGGGRGWRWVAVGVALSAGGEVLFWTYTALLDRGTPDLSWADPPWLLSYIAVGIGASTVLGLRGSGSRYREMDAILDMVTTGVVGLLVLWTFAIEPTLSDPSTELFTRLVWITYPILDVALLTALVGGILVMRRLSTASVLLCAGVVCWLSADFGLVLGLTDVHLGVWMDAGWMAGAVLLGLAVCEGGRAPARDASEPVRGAMGRLRLAVALGPLMVPMGIEVWGFEHGWDSDPWALALVTTSLVYLAFIRCLRLVRRKDQVMAELDAGERYYRTLTTNAADAVVVVSRSGVILHESPTFARLAGLTGPIVGVDATTLPFIADAEQAHDLLHRAAMAPGELVQAEILVRAAQGERWYALRVMDMVHESMGGVVVNMHDVTTRRRMEEELREQVFHDSLTGLANRALFRDRVGHALEGRGRTGIDPAVLFIDLDDFKYVNDSLGHDAGDLLLETVAARLLQAVRPGDTVARLGGDEFAVLIESAEGAADAPAVAERLLAIVPEAMEIAGRSLRVSCSVGIAYADERSDTSSLLRHADMAMYEAKGRGKGRWALYEPAMGAASRERMDLEGDLRVALEEGQLELVYQPIIEIGTGELTGFETLLRWNHPVIGTIAPDRFIPILEGNGHIIEVGAWVLAEACRTTAAWTEGRPPEDNAWSMSVNVSPVQLTSPRFVATVEDVLARTGVDPATLVLEITETSLIDDPATAAVRLKALHDLGVKLAIDDFGTGYSSLSYLREFPFDILKIDRSFIQSITADGPMPPIIKGLLDLARTLGIETVAEGIDELHQLAELRSQQCQQGQGFLFAKPLSAVDACAFLLAHRDGSPQLATGAASG